MNDLYAMHTEVFKIMLDDLTELVGRNKCDKIFEIVNKAVKESNRRDRE